MKPRPVNSMTMRSNVRAREFVAAAIFFELGVVAFDAQIAFGGPDADLPFRVGVRGMVAHLVAQRAQFGVDVGFAGRATPAPARHVQSGRGRTQRGGHVPAHPRLTVLDPLGQPHRTHRAEGPE